jgi:hypothetical protein
MIKSQDELNPCNDGHRSSDVLVATIEKCESLEQIIQEYKQILHCIDTERLPARCRKSEYEHSMQSINYIFEDMLDSDYNIRS